MSAQTTVPPVRKTVTVRQPVDQAFALFAGRISQWWPHDAASAGELSPLDGTVVLEPRPNGQLYRRREDGTIQVWGEVTVWDPPRRLVLAWRPAAESAAATEVEVTFTAEGEGTRVALEHRGWDALDRQSVTRRADYESGWGEVLAGYAAADGDNSSAVAALILGLASLLLPLLGLLAAPFAIAFGVAGRRQARRGARQGTVATAGLTLGVVGLVVWAVVAMGGLGVIMRSRHGEDVPVPVRTVQPR
ncbi:MAG: hypothetical protein QOH97_3499 [Actinoplanes sp.]|jgi:uncharacterized protein YndB with AHSA1/START domain|nr:hypothetical protein [Actinoplanes sp.]